MRAVVLLSGGFDSPVAAKMMQDQGVELVGLHASFEPVSDDASVQKAIQLARWLGLKELYVAKIGTELAKIPHHRDAHRYYFVLQKRLFYRLADQLADQVGADAIVTGENLGQVSSQTLSNLSTLEEAAKRPVIRPVLGLDKTEIIALAKDYGCHDISLGPELCDLLGPSKPATRSSVSTALEFEAQVGMGGVELAKIAV